MNDKIGLVKSLQTASRDHTINKVHEIKSLINTLGGNSTTDKQGNEKDKNSFRLIFSAIKNEYQNLANENGQYLNGNRGKVQQSATKSSVLVTTVKPEVNISEYEESDVSFADIVLEPLSEDGKSPIMTIFNNTYKYHIDKGNATDNRIFVNRTIDEDQRNLKNESFKRSFDFLTSSLYNYNVAEFFASGNNYVNSSGNIGNNSGTLWNQNNLTSIWESGGNTTSETLSPMQGNYWALVLVIFPFLTLFGNVLVILAVVRERTLQTATNYFIVSLALADLLVAVLVMPFAVYVLVNGAWSLPAVVCDFYIAMDVTCSTSSIFNLVAISIDRYIAVTQPIKYAKHKNTQRVWSTIALVWVISAAIGSPIVLGLNNTPDRIPDLCLFYNSDFIIYSSLSSFYIPCIIMVFLYYNIFKALRNRARKARATRKPNVGEILPGSVIENVAQTRRLAETTLGEPATTGGGSSCLEDERPTNTGSGSNDEEGGERSPGSEDIKELGIGADECEIIPNDKSTEFILSTVVEEAATVVAVASQPTFHDPNGNNDSGYAASNLEDTQTVHVTSPHHSPPRRAHTVPQFKGTSRGSSPATGQQRPSDPQPSPGKDQKSSSIGSRFTIYKVNKASKKKREKSSAKKERKATKTLAIVLGFRHIGPKKNIFKNKICICLLKNLRDVWTLEAAIFLHNNSQAIKIAARWQARMSSGLLHDSLVSYVTREDYERWASSSNKVKTSRMKRVRELQQILKR